MAPGVIARLPNELPKFVPLPLELLSCAVADVAWVVRDSLAEAFGWGDEDDVRILYQEKDLDTESASSSFLSALGSGRPCMVRVLLRLLGGKGGFGALLRKQMGMGKKTTNFDSMRDLSGRRLRHSKAVDRIKEWMENKKREEELAASEKGAGPELPKPTPASETLDPAFLEKLRRAEASRPAVVREGMRKLEADAVAAKAPAKPQADGGTNGAASAASQDQAPKRPRVGASLEAGNWASGLESLGNISSDSDDASKEPTSAAASGSGAASSSAAAAATVTCGKGHPCVRLTENPKELGYDEPACCDVCEAENLPGTCPFFYHCGACEYDVCPRCAALPPEERRRFADAASAEEHRQAQAAAAAGASSGASAQAAPGA